MANARFQTNGVDALLDALLSAGEEPADTRDRIWQVVWARGYQDISVPLPSPDLKIEGHVVLSRAFPSQIGLICVDDGERLLGFVDYFEVPPLGARVRAIPQYGTGPKWSIKAMLALGCGLEIRFDEGEGRTGDSSWVDRLRTCLARVREMEVGLRKRIEAQRREVTFVQGPEPFRNEMEKADKALRDAVLARGYTEDEKRMLARVKKPEDAQKIAAAAQKRMVDEYRAEVVTFREKIPELRADWDRRMAEYAEFRKQVDYFNAADAASRTITDQSLRCTQMLDPIETALFNVRATADTMRVEEDPRAAFPEMKATIELLFELLPKRLKRPIPIGQP